MYEYVYDLYDNIIRNSDSVIIILLVVLTLGIVVAFIPLYNAILKGRKADKQHEKEGRQQLIDVIEKNSSVIAELRTAMFLSASSHVKALDRIEVRLDNAELMINAIVAAITEVNAKVDNVSQGQVTMAKKIDKITIVVSGGELLKKE